MTFFPFGTVPALGLQATTGAAGFALVNGTPTILSWTAPDDGQLHRFQVFATVSVTEATTGGDTDVGFTAPDGTVGGASLIGGTANPGIDTNLMATTWICQGGTKVNVLQGSAVTAGAATLWAEIWGS